MNTEIGKVLGTTDAEPLSFWVAVPTENVVQLDDVVLVKRPLPDGKNVSIYGIVDTLVARHEGARCQESPHELDGSAARRDLPRRGCRMGGCP